MRTGKVIALVVTMMVAVPATAGAQARTDEQVRQAAAALPERLWEPGPDPVSAAGPTLPDGGGVAPLLALILLAVSAGAGYAFSLLRGATLPALAAPVESARRETCAITLAHVGDRRRFEVRVSDERAGDRVVAASPAFEVPAGIGVWDSGAAGQAHHGLLLQLAAAGWELEPRDDSPWYARRLSRPAQAPGEGEVDRALVTTRPDGGEAEFVALALDDFGNAQEIARSPRFVRRASQSVPETEPAVAAHAMLLEDLEAHGWRVCGRLESWYGATLARRRPR